MAYEKDLAAEAAPEAPGSRVSGSDADAGGQAGTQAAPGERAGTLDRGRPELVRGVPRLYRLRGRLSFERLRREGVRGTAGQLTVIVLPREDLGGKEPQRVIRLGVAISRRVGKAVVRNRLRRRLRAAVQEVMCVPEAVAGGTVLPGSADVLVAVRPGAAGASYRELRSLLAEALDRARGTLQATRAEGRTET